MERFEPTAEQLRVIAHRGSHALVFAGPGTGKTETLARRFASLVADDHLDPSAILVLTFSRRAADQMLERIVQRLEERRGAGLAVSELFVNTFHSFCARLLDGDGPRFRERNLLTPVKERLLFKRVAERVPLRSFDEEVRTSPTFATDALNLIAQLKGQGMKPADVDAAAGSDPRLRDIATMYHAMNEDRARLELSDFRDLVADALDALRSPDTPAARWLRDRGGFRHILVDEFQDSDILQLELLKMLAGPEPQREHPNPEICFVGDFNQSIYRFRGAAPENISSAQRIFACRELELSTNRRSAQAILDVANATPQLDPKSLTTAEDQAVQGSVALARPADPGAEVELICNEIAARIHAGIPAREIAVLLRVTEPYQSDIVAGLDARGIPVAARPIAGFLADPVIGAVLTAMRLLALDEPTPEQNERDREVEHALWTRLLTNPVIGFRAVGVRMAFDAARRDHLSGALPALHRYPPDGVRPFRQFARAWERVVKDARDADAASVLLVIARELDLLRPVREETAPAGFDLRASPARLGALAEAARDMVATERALSGKVVEPARLIADIAELSGLVADPAEAPPADADGVHVMSIHAAKGLEFDCVIVPQALDGTLPQRERGHALLPHASVQALRRHGSALFAEPSEVNREECSLWYVALTRARREVLVTAAAADRDDIELALSPFAYGIPMSIPGAKAPALHEESAGAKAPAPQITEPEVQPRRPVRRAIERLSPSMVSTFLICPRRFFYHYVLRLKPEMDKEVTLLGKLLHRTLAAFHLDERSFAARDDFGALRAAWRTKLIDLLEREMREAAVELRLPLDAGFLRYTRAAAERHLDEYAAWLEQEARSRPFTVQATELELDGAIAGVAFHGLADRVDRLESGGLVIRDFKASRRHGFLAKTLRQAFERLDTGEPLAGDVPTGLNLQLPLYMALAEEKYGERVVRVQYVYFRGKSKQEGALLVDDVQVLDDAERGAGLEPELFLTRAEIAQAVDAIAAAIARDLAAGRLEAFATASDESTCRWCDFKDACTGAGTVA
ncbi:MAG TPA: ATP-dependent DNA helicase [Candidatus Tumulicola sp.]|nr:ATP-dependent DNA helicase [Candidatus Tumulicola sp.]